MEKITDKMILFALGTLLASETDGFLAPVAVSLTALIYAAFSLYFVKREHLVRLMLCFLILCAAVPELAVFLPLACYDGVFLEVRPGWALLAALPVIRFFGEGEKGFLWTALWLFSIGLSVFLPMRTRKQLQMKADLIHLRDSSRERTDRMQMRQKELLEKQDYEIHLATLQERNRIAREIHDNVGHLLSRSILQMGALLTVHKEEPLRGQLAAVNETLDEAMDKIRESVHDLHNESFDLRQAVRDAAGSLGQKYEVSLDYDMGEAVPRDVKYCLAAIAKEALSNVVRHSSATRVTLLLREHPGFYQMLVEDNGTGVSVPEHPGIGLFNMKDRAEALNGTIRFSTENGFGVLVSIPKETDGKKG